MAKISAYNAITQVQSNDLLVTVDVNDTSMAPAGTDKKMTLSQLWGATAAWQFTPEAYGAKGDGKVISDVTTNGTSTIVSATIGAEGTAAVGKYIMIHGANGTTGGPYLGHITAVSGNNVTVSGTAPSGSASSCPAVYGTDDTAAINSAISAAGTYALANQYFAEVVFSAKIYMSASLTQQTSPAQYNTQILIPYPDLAGATQKLVIALTGPGDNGFCQYWESLVPNVAGAAIVSVLTAPGSTSGTYGTQSVIGGPSAGGAFTGGYANTKVVVKGLAVWCPLYTNMYAYDFGYLSDMRVQQSAAHIFAPTGVNNSAVQPYLNNISASAFTNSIGSGIRTPVSGNNDDVTADDCTVEGYECAWRVFDHFTAGRIAAIYSDVAMKFDSSQGIGTSHEISVVQMSAEAYNGGFLTSGGTAQIDISWDAEVTSPAYDVSDAANALRGLFRFRDPAGARFPVVSGAADLKIICDELGPGVWASPPVPPATTVAQQNTAWRDAMIYLSSTGTITAMKVDSAAIPITSGAASSVFVPAGHTWTPTYSGSLSSVWVLA